MRTLLIPLALALAVLILGIALVRHGHLRAETPKPSAPFHEVTVCKIVRIEVDGSQCESLHYSSSHVAAFVYIPGEHPLGEEYKVTVEDCKDCGDQP